MKDLLSHRLHEGSSPERIVGDEDMREGNLANIGKKSEGNVFEQLMQIYGASLKLDQYDVEANFNLGSLYMLRADNTTDIEIS